MPLFRKGSRTDVSDPVKLLVLDHEKVERIFHDIAQSDSVAERHALRSQLELELERHTAIEERILYPFIRDHVSDGASMIDESMSEHEEAKRILERLARADAGHDDFITIVKELQKAVSHHVKDEEHEVFPKLDAEVSGRDLGMLRGQLEAAKVEESPRPSLPSETRPRSTRTSRPKTTTSTTKTSTRSGRSTAPRSRTRDESVWVQPHHTHDGRWQVRRGNAARASRVFDTQSEAVKFGRGVARRDKVEFILTGRDGAIREKNSYGNDPRNVRG